MLCICHHTRVKDALGTKNNQKRICKPKRIHFLCHDFILAGKGIEQFLLRSSSSSIDYVSCLMTKLLHQKTPQDPHLPKAVSQSSLHQAVERLPIEKMEKVIVSGDAAHVKPQLQRSGLRIKINECQRMSQGMSSNLEMIQILKILTYFNPEPGTFSNRIPASERVQQKTKWPLLNYFIVFCYFCSYSLFVIHHKLWWAWSAWSWRGRALFILFQLSGICDPSSSLRICSNTMGGKEMRQTMVEHGHLN